jgi:uncharacterized protein involved in outer membrane biogenesis
MKSMKIIVLTVILLIAISIGVLIGNNFKNYVIQRVRRTDGKRHI